MNVMSAFVLRHLECIFDSLAVNVSVFLSVLANKWAEAKTNQRFIPFKQQR